MTCKPTVGSQVAALGPHAGFKDLVCIYLISVDQFVAKVGCMILPCLALRSTPRVLPKQ